MSRRRTRARRLPTRRLVYLALFLLAALVGSSFVRVTLLDKALALESAGVRAELAGLEAQRTVLETQVAVHASDAFVQQKARELGYVKPGEGLASVRDAPAVRETRVATSTNAPSRLERWLALFFHP